MSQLTLSFEAGLTERYSNLRECVTACVYNRGLGRVAIDLDKAPGNLGRELAGDSDRHFSVEALERYIQTQGDLTPIYYLIAATWAIRRRPRRQRCAGLRICSQRSRRRCRRCSRPRNQCAGNCLMASPMPTVSVWADDLRAEFGAAEFNAGLKEFGYMASENGRTIDTRKLLGGTEVSACDMVIRPLPDVVAPPVAKARRG